MKLPVTYEQFLKNPIVGLMFLTISALAYLYISGERKSSEDLERCYEGTTKLESDREFLTMHLRKRDSALAYASAMLRMKDMVK